jgi:hypothetical protein
MFARDLDRRRCALPLAVSLCALLCASPALAEGPTNQEATPAKKDDLKRPTVSQAKPSSPNMSINLINLLIKQGTLTEEEGQSLIKQAEDEAYVTRQATKDATAKADEAAKALNTANAAAEPAGTRHVTYVPEVVKRQLREEIKQEVMEKAQKENWASPGKYPEWAQRIHFYGDLRARFEGNIYPGGNGPLENFNAINTGSPFAEDATNPYLPATYNTTQNRDRFRLRARLGLDADLFDNFTAGLRIATGENSSPVSTSQTLGANGGNFSKYALWLDRGFLKYKPSEDAAFFVGRFDNPFWSPTDLVWQSDLGFDGAAVQVKREVIDGFTPFAALGAFPIFNTDLNAGINLDSNNSGIPEKVSSTDKYLFGGQFGFSTKINPDTNLRLAFAYYDFANVQGRQSSLCVVASASDACDTDTLRPSFAQKGNTYMALRNIFQTVGATTPFNYQYYGLASQYRPVVVTGQLDFAQFNPIHVILDGEYVWNSAFDGAAVAAIAVNNFGSSTTSGVNGRYEGGNQGWYGRITVGDKEIKQFGDWNMHAGYKYLESDATLDAFADSDFGLGGTNLKGYFVGGNLGLSQSVSTSLRWMSAKNIAGLPYAVDVVQLDLKAKF